MRGYKGIMFAFDGDWVTDFEAATIEGVETLLAERGSCWYFYPIDGVVRAGRTTPRTRILRLSGGLSSLQGKTVAAVSKELKENPGMFVAIE